MGNEILKAVDVCKSFANNGGQNHVLDMVNFSVYEGDFTVIMGASGAGKSTLLYALSVMDAPTAGRVFYRGREITALKEKQMAALRAQEFGFVFQQVHLVSHLTLWENVAVAGYLKKGRGTKETKERALALLERMDAAKAKDRMLSQVSGGEAQRAAVARALINEPGILFADEPTGALNKHNTKEVLDLFTQIHRAGQSIVMVTHDIKAAARGNRFLYLEDGRIIGEMTLPPFEEAESKSRETQLDAWLTSLNW